MVLLTIQWTIDAPAGKFRPHKGLYVQSHHLAAVVSSSWLILELFLSRSATIEFILRKRITAFTTVFIAGEQVVHDKLVTAVKLEYSQQNNADDS